MATITDLELNTNGEDSRGIINTNFDNLNTDKAELSGATYTGAILFSGTDHLGIKAINLTTAQRDALTPANGYIIYNTSDSEFQLYENGSWVTLAGVANASETVKGIVEIGTDTEIDARTELGSTGAVLAVPADSTLTLKTVERAALDASNSPSGANPFITDNDTAESGASKVIKSKANSKIDDSLVALTTAGDTVYSDGTDLQRLGIGTARQVLKTNTGATAPAWAGVGSVVSFNSTAVTVASSGAETTLYQTSVGAGLLGTDNGVIFRIPLSSFGINNGQNSVLRLKYGATTIATLTVSNASGAEIDCNYGWIEGRLFNTGATNTQYGYITLEANEAGAFQTADTRDRAYGFADGTGAEDSTGALNLTITVDHSESAAAAKITAENYTLQLLEV